MGSFFGTLSDFCHTVHMAIFGKLFYNLYSAGDAEDGSAAKFTMWEHTYWALFEASHRIFSNSAVVPDLALCMYTLNKHRQKCNLLFNFYLTQDFNWY